MSQELVIHRTPDEIQRQYDAINKLIEDIAKTICPHHDVLAQLLSPEENAKTEFCPVCNYPADVDLAAMQEKSPLWYDGFKYGLYRGWWQALAWVLDGDGYCHDLITDDDL